jgi:NADH-quinone oxidoreductase subunit M
LVIFALSSLGLPGTNSFVGEFMVLAGTFIWSKLATALASLGIILAAAYMLWMIQRVAFGLPSPHVLPALRDLDRREMATLIPLVILVFLIGIFPNPILTRMHASVNQVLARTSVPTAATALSPDDQLLPVSTDGDSLALETSRP